MTPLTILQFLIGNRSAIEQIAACRQAPWLGLIFVFSAGLAREYDGQDLLHEPWHLLLPLVASLATSFLLYLLLRTVGWFRGAGWKPFFAGYWSFLGLYWMTAPLALVYGIPVERFLDQEIAACLNLNVLALVAAWRVLLIIRVASVLWSASPSAVFFPVMLMADTVAIVAIVASPTPIVGLMAGVQYGPGEELIGLASHAVLVLAHLSWLIWLVGTLGVGFGRRGWSWLATPMPGQVARLTWVIAALTLVMWIPSMFYTQPEQVRRRSVERAFRSGRTADAVAILTKHERDDFPPYWDPPPRVTYGETKGILDVTEAVVALPEGHWLRDVYARKLSNYLSGPEMFTGSWLDLSVPDLNRVTTILEQQPIPGDDYQFRRSLRGLVDRLNSDPKIPPELKERLKTLLGERSKEVLPKPQPLENDRHESWRQ